jgi:acetyl/propionyl-CoA carboxylase alpha subunit
MSIKKVLIANRGEIAIRIARAAADLGIQTVAIYSEDDDESLHIKISDESICLNAVGAQAYLNIDNIVSIAKENQCDAIHPGYGFLSENSQLAAACETNNLIFIGPNQALLELFGDKAKARQAATKAGVPIVQGTDKASSLADCEKFFRSLGKNAAVMIKALAGGGGRGTRVVTDIKNLEEAYLRCQSEAKNAFGNDELYVEELIQAARHIEVQIIGDKKGTIVAIGDRECSVQRRHQKIIEIAPSCDLPEATRQAITQAAKTLAQAVEYFSLGTFEFLVDANSDNQEKFAFIEANARLQVEHTVTEQVTGVDLVQTQIEIADNKTLAELDLSETPLSKGVAIQARVNMETLQADGSVRPTTGEITAYDPPSGPGVRIDGFGYAGFFPSTNYDSLLAKVIVHSKKSSLEEAARKCARALSEFRIEGLDTNVPFLRSVLKHQDFLTNRVTTRWIDENADSLIQTSEFDIRHVINEQSNQMASGLAGAQVDNSDPLAVFAYDKGAERKSQKKNKHKIDLSGPNGSVGIPAPIQGTILEIQVNPGDKVAAGMPLIVMEAMKMEHQIRADRDGIINSISVSKNEIIIEGHPLVFIEEGDVGDLNYAENDQIDLDEIRPDLQENFDRHAHLYDENRPKAIERRRQHNQRTARENISDLCDENTFIEYGSMVLAAQRKRRSVEWLRENTPADGLIMGVGHVNGALFPKTESRCAVVHYDYTVLAGTQGLWNHNKQDRIFHLAERFKLPVILYSEGGGGRPGDTDGAGGLGMEVETFTQWSKLSGLVPLVGVNSRYCFAGNTALLACCDVIIATKNSIIGMGGPAMIEAGGLGIFAPDEVAPTDTQVSNGVIDILVEDEIEATKVAKQYISYFQGAIDDWVAPDQRRMRSIVPENRKEIYNVRDVIETLADKDSILEIRKDFGIGIVTSLIRVEGKPMGLIANNPHHIAGAIDSDGADKGARFLQLCDAFDLPVVSIMDCPGIMVGPEVEKTALVRHCARMFNTGANLSVPMFGLIIRKAYGLGVQAMCGGSSKVPFFTAAWPTAEFAGMAIEGSVKLAYRSEFQEMDSAEERIKVFTERVDKAYERAKAVNSAEFYGIEDVIDPATSRDWIVAGLNAIPPTPPRTSKKRPYIDTW